MIAPHTWDPAAYLTYADERGRPFVDLLTRVGAVVTGLDSSPEMIGAARAGQPDLDFEVGDLREWRGTADVVLSNATLQWLPDHLDLLPALVAATRPGGWLAFQVPGDLAVPESHDPATSRPDLGQRHRGAADPAGPARRRDGGPALPPRVRGRTGAGGAATRLHHVQVACPPGGEGAARAFYAGALGLTEVDKPAALRGRGGAWFRSHDERGAVVAELHVGVEDPFVAARKAHPALVVPDETALDAAAARAGAIGCEVDHSERHTFEGYLRVHLRDPHGNRVELLAPHAPGDRGPTA